MKEAELLYKQRAGDVHALLADLIIIISSCKIHPLNYMSIHIALLVVVVPTSCLHYHFLSYSTPTHSPPFDLKIGFLDGTVSCMPP